MAFRDLQAYSPHLTMPAPHMRRQELYWLCKQAEHLFTHILQQFYARQLACESRTIL